MRALAWPAVLCATLLGLAAGKRLATKAEAAAPAECSCSAHCRGVVGRPDVGQGGDAASLLTCQAQAAPPAACGTEFCSAHCEAIVPSRPSALVECRARRPKGAPRAKSLAQLREATRWKVRCRPPQPCGCECYCPEIVWPVLPPDGLPTFPTPAPFFGFLQTGSETAPAPGAGGPPAPHAAIGAVTPAPEGGGQRLAALEGGPNFVFSALERRATLSVRSAVAAAARQPIPGHFTRYGSHWRRLQRQNGWRRARGGAGGGVAAKKRAAWFAYRARLQRAQNMQIPYNLLPPPPVPPPPPPPPNSMHQPCPETAPCNCYCHCKAPSAEQVGWTPKHQAPLR